MYIGRDYYVYVYTCMHVLVCVCVRMRMRRCVLSIYEYIVRFLCLGQG